VNEIVVVSVQPVDKGVVEEWHGFTPRPPLLLKKRVRCKNDKGTLRFYTNSASRSVQFEYAVWLPLRVFEVFVLTARSLRSLATYPHRSCYCRQCLLVVVKRVSYKSNNGTLSDQ